MSKIIEVVVSPNGQTRIQTKGFVGSACQEASEFLERALGKVMVDKPTSESHRVQESNRIRNQN